MSTFQTWQLSLCPQCFTVCAFSSWVHIKLDSFHHNHSACYLCFTIHEFIPESTASTVYSQCRCLCFTIHEFIPESTASTVYSQCCCLCFTIHEFIPDSTASTVYSQCRCLYFAIHELIPDSTASTLYSLCFAIHEFIPNLAAFTVFTVLQSMLYDSWVHSKLDSFHCVHSAAVYALQFMISFQTSQLSLCSQCCSPCFTIHEFIPNLTAFTMRISYGAAVQGMDKEIQMCFQNQYFFPQKIDLF